MRSSDDVDALPGAARRTWHVRARTRGLTLISVAVVAMVTSFPFIAGDPGPGSPAGKKDPAWFPVVGAIAVSFLIVGILLVVAPPLFGWVSSRGARKRDNL